MNVPVSMTVNGKDISADVEPRTLLVHFLREQMRLTGTHVACDTSQCGACLVHLNGRAVKSCTTLALQAEGAEVLTIEGLAKGEQLHPMQAAFKEHHGLQCGFCTPGMVMSALEPRCALPRSVGRNGSPRTRGQHLPLYRLSQYRQGDLGRREGNEGITSWLTVSGLQ